MKTVLLTSPLAAKSHSAEPDRSIAGKSIRTPSILSASCSYVTTPREETLSRLLFGKARNIPKAENKNGSVEFPCRNTRTEMIPQTINGERQTINERYFFASPLPFPFCLFPFAFFLFRVLRVFRGFLSPRAPCLPCLPWFYFPLRSVFSVVEILKGRKDML
ncbi:MAG: hypothetical protein D6679_06430 [Candidatus Hydrogenedentota bacterium]|nr:MAG: hypothetical protein D6679_06430 [Candidatus Hydrogenedentota bacterium]